MNGVNLFFVGQKLECFTIVHKKNTFSKKDHLLVEKKTKSVFSGLVILKKKHKIL